MKRALLVVILACGLSSCGLFKKVTRTVDKEQTKTEQTVTNDSVGVTRDKSTTTIKERVDTTISTPERTVITEQVVNMDSLIQAVTNIKNDLFTVKLDYNKATGILRTTTTLLPQRISVKMDRVTTKQNDITTKSQVNQKATLNTTTKKKAVVKEKEPAKMGIWLVALIVGIGAIGASIWYWLKKRLPV